MGVLPLALLMGPSRESHPASGIIIVWSRVPYNIFCQFVQKKPLAWAIGTRNAGRFVRTFIPDLLIAIKDFSPLW